MKYIIHAYEQSYGALHGIESWYIFESETIKEAEDDACCESCELMNSYEFIENDIRDKAIFYSGETEGEKYEEAYSDAMSENIAYTIYSSNENFDDSILLKDDFEDFIKNNCVIVSAC